MELLRRYLEHFISSAYQHHEAAAKTCASNRSTCQKSAINKKRRRPPPLLLGRAIPVIQLTDMEIHSPEPCSYTLGPRNSPPTTMGEDILELSLEEREWRWLTDMWYPDQPQLSIDINDETYTQRRGPFWVDDSDAAEEAAAAYATDPSVYELRAQHEDSIKLLYVDDEDMYGPNQPHHRDAQRLVNYIVSNPPAMPTNSAAHQVSLEELLTEAIQPEMLNDGLRLEYLVDMLASFSFIAHHSVFSPQTTELLTHLATHSAPLHAYMNRRLVAREAHYIETITQAFLEPLAYHIDKILLTRTHYAFAAITADVMKSACNFGWLACPAAVAARMYGCVHYASKIDWISMTTLNSATSNSDTSKRWAALLQARFVAMLGFVWQSRTNETGKFAGLKMGRLVFRALAGLAEREHGRVPGAVFMTAKGELGSPLVMGLAVKREDAALSTKREDVDRKSHRRGQDSGIQKMD